jgi:hypothetical protein
MSSTSLVARRFAGLSAAVFLGVVSLAGLVSAQIGTATISGQVKDESGGILPGVTVSAKSPALQVPEVTTVTDAQGEYRLTPLPIGTYTVAYALSGFQTVHREAIRLTAGFTARVDIQLKVGQLEETVTVSGASPLVDAASTATATQLTKETLELVPTSRNGYIGLMQQAPGARPNLDVGGSTTNAQPAFRAFGQQGQSWQAVDGVVTANPKSDTQSGNYVDYSILEEATISTIGHEASIPTRGIAINSIVKTGSNNFHGSGFFSGTSHRFESNNIDDDLRAQGVTAGNTLQLRDDTSGDVGGRIVRDKLWFYAAGRQRRDHNGILECFKPDGTGCVETQYAWFFTHKETLQMNASNRFTGFTMFNKRSDIENMSRVVAWESRRNQRGFNGAWKTEWEGVKGRAIVANLMVGGFWNHSGGYGEEFGLGKPATLDSVTRFVTGTSTTMNERNFEDRLQARGNLSWYKPDWLGGNHEIKVGSDFFKVRADRQRLPRPAGSGNYQLIFRSGAADQISVFNTPVFPDAPLRTMGGYAQDSWTIGRKLTLNIGARYNYDNGYVAAGCREAADPPGDVPNPAQCFDKVQFKIYKSLSPRLRAAYDISGNGKTVVKGGWGRYHKLRYTDELQTANRNVITTTLYRWRDLNGNRNYDPGETNLSLSGTDFLSQTLSGQGGALANGVANPNEQQPYTDEYSVQFEHELVPNFAMRVTGAHSRALRQYRLANLRRPFESYSIPITNRDPGPDGVVNTADDPGTTITYYEYPTTLSSSAFQVATIVNDEKANQKYSTLEVAASRRLVGKWQMMASYSATKRNVPLPNNVGGGTAFGANTQDPNAEIFAADNNWEWLGRVSGSYLLPYGLQTSANFEHRSGAPWARTALFRGGATIPSITLNVEPIGTRRLPNINLLDFRLEKRFSLRPKQQFQLQVNIFNALNINDVTAVTQQSGPSFGLATAIVLPRIVAFSARYIF